MQSRRRSTTRALVVVLMLLAVACSNSKAKTASETTTPPDSGSATTGGGATSAPDEHVTVSAPGITDTEIRVGGVASVTNPLGGRYQDSFAGVQAYFDMINAEGGIYGRKLVLAAKRDDQLANNKSEVQGLLTQDKVFAVLPVATLLFSGAQLLVDQKVPTFGWTINEEWGGTAADPRSNMFGQTGSFLGFDAATPILPWLAGQLKRHKIGLLAYSVSQSSQCADGVKNSFKKFGGAVDADVAFVDQSLSFGVSDLSVQVSKMKKAGVDLITTCMDNNGVVTVAKEMKKQRLDAIQYMPDAYDQDFMKEFGDLFEGSVVRTDFVQFEAKDKPEGLTNFLTWIAKEGTKPNENALDGWLNANLFVDGLKKAGPNFDRPKLIDAINSMTDFTADGLIKGVDWTKAHTMAGDTCQFFSTIQDSKFVPNYSRPGKPFVCPTAAPGNKIETRYAA